MSGVRQLLLLTSFIGTIIGFFICYQIFIHLQGTYNRLGTRICMMNSMSLAFIFAMFIELATGSKVLSILLPMITICIPILWFTKFNIIDAIEACTATLMSVSMSVMLIGMMNVSVIFIIQVILVLIEAILMFAVLPRINVRQ